MDIKDFEDVDSLEEAVLTLEREMKAMWDTNEVLHIMKDDKAFIFTILIAMHYETARFMDEIGVIIGEA